MKRLALAVPLVLLLAAAASPPTPPRIMVLAFFEERGGSAAFARLQAEASRISVLIPESYDFDAATQTAVLRSPPRPAVAAFAYGRGIGVWPAVNAQLGGRPLFGDPAKRARAVASIAAVAARWDGVTVDIEGVAPGDRDGFTAFVQALARAVHRKGKGVAIYLPRRTATTVTSWAAPYDYPAIAAACDHVLVGSYSESWEHPGPVVTDAGYRDLLDYLAGISPTKLSPTIGTLSERWPPGAGKPVVGLSDEVGAFPGRVRVGAAGGEDGFSDRGGDTVWYETPQALVARVKAAREAGFSTVGLFILGHEPLSFWSQT